MIGNDPMVVQKTEYIKGGRSSAKVSMKLKNLLTGANSETIVKADDKFDVVVLSRKNCKYSYFADPMYVFMDDEFNQYEIEAENIGDALKFIVDGMDDVCEVTFYEGSPISVELPTIIVREVEYTEPAVKGDTSGKVMKTARLVGGTEIQVMSYVEIQCLRQPEHAKTVSGCLISGLSYLERQNRLRHSIRRRFCISGSLKSAFFFLLAATAHAIHIQRVVNHAIAVFRSDFFLQPLNFLIVELGNLAAFHADQMVMVRTLVQLVHRLARFKMVPQQNARLFKLRQHTVNRCHADFHALFQQRAVNVFRAHVRVGMPFKQVQDFQPRTGYFQPVVLQLRDVVHVFSFGLDTCKIAV